MPLTPTPARPSCRRIPSTSRLLRWAALGALGLAAATPHGATAQTAGAARAGSAAEKEMEVPHAFFTHEGLAEGVGVWNLRSAALATRADGRTEGDFALHLETGITERIGLHLRNDRFGDLPRSEAMFQFAAVTSGDGMSGFAPLVEFEVPTRSGAGRRVNTLVGFTTKLANSRAAFNSVVHYDPREDMTDNSASLVFGATDQIFPVVEALTEIGRAARPIANALAGVKLRLREGILVGLAYQVPITRNKDLASQLVAQPDLEWRVRR